MNPSPISELTAKVLGYPITSYCPHCDATLEFVSRQKLAPALARTVLVMQEALEKLTHHKVAKYRSVVAEHAKDALETCEAIAREVLK